MAADSSILTWSLALPLVGGGIILAMPQATTKQPWIGARALAMTFTLGTLIVVAMAAGWFDYHSGQLQLQHAVTWFNPTGLRYAVGVDGFSIPLLLLVAGMGVLACWASYAIKHDLKRYFALLLWAVAAGLCLLIAQDESLAAAATIALVIIIFYLSAGWGNDRRLPAARRFLQMGLCGAGAVMAGLAFSRATSAAPLWTGILFAGFALLIAVVPLHVWLADLLTESTTPVGMLVVAVLQTAAAFGIWRWAYSLLVRQGDPSGWLAWLGIAVAAYATLAAIGQKNLMRMAASVSIAQMGFFLLGLAMRQPQSGDVAGVGAAFLLVAHGLSSGMFVLVSGMIRDRVGHTDIDRLGGLAGHLPAFAAWSAIAILGAMSMPGLCSFAGELLILMGTFSSNVSSTNIFSATPPAHGFLLGVAAAAIMMLLLGTGAWTFQRVFLGTPRAEHANIARMSHSERWILTLLGLAVIALGLAPFLVTEAFRASVR